MSRSLKDDGVVDVQELGRKNPNVDTEKVLKVKELLQRLRDQGVSRQGYKLAPPFRRQMYVESKHKKVGS